MLIMINRRSVKLIITALVLLALPAIAYGLKGGLPVTTNDDSLGFKIYVQGLGTVRGAWTGSMGIALIGVETRPDTDPAKELKVMTLLVANQSKKIIRFEPDIALVDKQGKAYDLQGASQPQVEIAPGTLSQGVVIIDVPKGNRDENWTLKLSGGPITGAVSLPLRVVTVKED